MKGGAWKRKNAFIHPLTPAPRTAVLVPWFHKSRFVAGAGFGPGKQIQVFPEGWNDRAAAFAPCSIAATREQIYALEQVSIPSLTHALIVLERAGEARLSEDDRERLWRGFHLPIFERVIGESGELLAAECEAHDGLHVESPRLPLDQETLDRSACACGRTTPRLAPSDGGELLRHVAAYAR